MATTGSTFDSTAIDAELHEIEERIAQQQRLAEKAEFNRIDRMECPVCKSNDKTRHRLMNDNGILGPGYSSHVILEFYICNTCGVHYSDLNKKKT